MGVGAKVLICLSWFVYLVNTEMFGFVSFHDRILGQMLFQSQTDNELICSRRCAKTAGCNFFSFATATGTCQLASNSTRTTGATNVVYGRHAEALECPFDTVRYEDSCYHLSENVADWTSAKADCEIHGAHLVTISSAGENQFVTNLVKTAHSYVYVWLGGTITANVSNWATGEDWTYSNWYSGFPYYMADKQCVMMAVEDYLVEGVWGQDPCTIPNIFMCEMEL